MKIAADTPFDPDLNVRMQLEKELDKKDRPIQKNVGYVFKDRSDTFNGKRFVFPTYRNFKPLVDFIVGIPTGKVAGETFTNNLTPGGDYDYYDKRNKQQIETEIISGIFDKYEHNNY